MTTDATATATASQPSSAEMEEFRAWKASQAPQQPEQPSEKEYYVHLASGDTVRLKESDEGFGATHYDGIQVIGTYEVGA